MLAIFAESLMLATRLDRHVNREHLARLRREDEDYIRNSRRAHADSLGGR